MAQRFPNRTSQAGIYYSGGAGYLDVDSTFSAPSTYFSFPSIAAADGWISGDVVDVFVQQSADPTIWAVWTTRWDEANEYLLFDAEQNSQGTLNDSDAVSVTATVTKNFANTYEIPDLLAGMWELQETVEVTNGQTEIILAIPAGHDSFQITTSGLAMATTGAAYIALQLSKDGGATWEDYGYHSTFTELFGGTPTSSYSQNQPDLKLTTEQSILPGSVNGSVIAFALNNPSAQAMFDSTFTSVEQSGGYYWVARRSVSGALVASYGIGTFNMARLFVSAGSFAAGTVKSWARN